MGLVTGVSSGVATIFYFVSNSCGSSFAQYIVGVTPGASAGTITTSSTLSSICQNNTTQMLTSGSSGGTWNSSNPAVALIDGVNGAVLGLNPGTTTISYTVAANSCSATSSVAYYTLTVNPSGNAGAISGPGNVCVGSSVLLSSNGSAGGNWFSANPAAASVNPFGLVTGIAPGSAVIYYFVSNTCGSSFAQYSVLVSPVANAGVISGSSLSVPDRHPAGEQWHGRRILEFQ